MNYYNEFDKGAAAWLRELIATGAIPKGEVDERSITDVTAGDLRGFTQCHFFAGIAGWPEALRRAGVPSTRPLWTGSCPCQDYSCAGKGKGMEGKRDLWPKFFRLIRECRPVRVLGEQVSAAIGHGWLDRLSADMEAEGYAVGQVVLGAHSAGADHIRQRLYWVADAQTCGRKPQPMCQSSGVQRETFGEFERLLTFGGYGSGACWLADAEDGGLGADGRAPWNSGHPAQRDTVGRVENASCVGRRGRGDGDPSGHGGALQVEGSGTDGRVGIAEAIGPKMRDGVHGELHGQGSCEGRDAGRMVFAGEQGLQGHAGNGGDRDQPGRNGAQPDGPASEAGLPRNFWSDAIAIPCRDNCFRRAQPGIFPLVARSERGVGYSGDPFLPEYANNTSEARVMLLKGYGNAICVETARLFIEACEDVLGAKGEC